MEPNLDTAFKRKSFLVVDDQSLSRSMIKSALKNMGFDAVECVDSAQEAMSFLQEQPVDFIIADWRMPHVSGIDLLKWVRGQGSLSHVPYLMLTGEATRTAVITAIQAGASDYMTKPFSLEELRGKIMTLLIKSRVLSDEPW